MAAAARLSLLDVKDDALFHMLGFFTHGGGKVRFTRVSRVGCTERYAPFTYP